MVKMKEEKKSTDMDPKENITHLKYHNIKIRQKLLNVLRKFGVYFEFAPDSDMSMILLMLSLPISKQRIVDKKNEKVVKTNAKKSKTR
jgi:hypothetical protein